MGAEATWYSKQIYRTDGRWQAAKAREAKHSGRPGCWRLHAVQDMGTNIVFAPSHWTGFQELFVS